MSKITYFEKSSSAKGLILGLLGLLLLFISAASTADIVWSGDFNDRNFLNYHTSTDAGKVLFFLVPEYGRPPQYGGQGHVGNGELLDLVSSPTRGSNYAARFTVKSLAKGGVETRDCDPALDCRTRRSQLQMTSTLLNYYHAIPYGAERWMSISLFVPNDFDSQDSGWGPIVWGSKGNLQNAPGWAGLQAKNSGWVISHRYYSKDMHFAKVDAGASWWLTVDYSSTFPNSNSWAQGLIDFPNEATSKAALKNLNRGGWTDFVFHFRTDVSDYSSNFESRNTGYWDVFMRAGSEAWVHVLAIRPMENLSRVLSWPSVNPGRIYNRGVGQYAPGGYTSQMGLYMHKNTVWGGSSNLVIFMDNHKIGDENSTFSDMSHDGSSPGKPGPAPKPPENFSAE